MVKRRPSGDGTIRKRSDGRWEGIIVAGHKENGKPIFRNVLARTQKEVTEKLHALIAEYDGIELTEDSNMTLAAWLDRWLNEYAKNNLRKSTADGYDSYCRNHVKPSLGDMVISRIGTVDVQKFYNRMKAVDQLSDSTVRSIHMMLHEAFDAAVSAHLIPSNPTENTTVPKANHKEKHVFTDAELEKFLTAIQRDEQWRDFFYTELTTGLRRGEICGLQWSDFDTDNGTLTVRRSVSKVKRNGEITVGETKTETGKRMLVLPVSTAERLRKRQPDSYGIWIFGNPANPEYPVSPSAAYQKLKQILSDNHLPDLRFHDLRHNFATHAIAGGVDAKTLSGILGHTNASFTLDTYTHVTSDMQRHAAQVIGDFTEELFGEELTIWQKEKTAAED